MGTHFKLSVFSILFPLVLHAQEAGTLKLFIDGFQSDEGQVRIALANSEENYSRNKEIYRGVSTEIRDRLAVYIFEDVPFGEYAVKVFHDENNNGDLDTNFLGIPNEDYGFSNNAKATFGPPAWSDARFFFNSAVDSISITVD